MRTDLGFCAIRQLNYPYAFQSDKSSIHWAELNHLKFKILKKWKNTLRRSDCLWRSGARQQTIQNFGGNFGMWSLVFFANTAQLVFQIARNLLRFAQCWHLAPAFFVKIELKKQFQFLFVNRKKPGISRIDSPGSRWSFGRLHNKSTKQKKNNKKASFKCKPARGMSSAQTHGEYLINKKHQKSYSMY